jgi:addiction module HigA family antidote
VRCCRKSCAIVAGERGVTAGTALRLARALGTNPEFWLNVQQTYDLRTAETTSDLRGVKRAVRKG